MKLLKLKKILIYNTGGGLGDSIQMVNLILSLKKRFDDYEIYLLQGNQEYFFENKLKDLNLNFIKKTKIEILHFGFRLKHFFEIDNVIKRNNLYFDIIIDLQSKLRNTLILKKIPHAFLFSSTLNFFFNFPKILIKNKSKSINERIIESLKIYTQDNFEIIKYDTKLINTSFNDEAKRLLPDKNYVGLSITQGNPYRKKSLQLNTILEITKYLISINKKPVFLIEKKYSDLKNTIEKKVNKVLFPEFESKINNPCLTIMLGKRLDYAITIDNGVMHLLSLANVPMVAIFGPTSADKFAPKVDIIKILSSQKLFNSKNINLITPKFIIDQIDSLEKKYF
jgi:ADP-heptose:LPS heptosyltransferase